MSSFSQSFSRRSLLRLGVGASAVAGSAALLSACGSGSSQQSGSQGGSLSGSKSSANPNGYSDDGQNYSGLVEYTHYEGALNYEQGTVDHPPRNAPKPKVTDTLSLNTVTGFHEAIAYFAAAMDYLVKTGSTDAFSTGVKLSSKTRSEVDALSASILAGVEKGSWYVNPSASYALASAQPSIMSDGNLLFKGQYTLDFGTEAVAEGKIQPVAASASASASASAEPTEPSEDALVSDAASPSASASATAAGPASRVTIQECDFRGRYHADSKMWELSVAYGATIQGGTAQGGASTASAAASGSASEPSSASASAEASATSAAS